MPETRIMTLGNSEIELNSNEARIIQKILRLFKREMKELSMVEIGKKVGGHPVSVSKIVMMLVAMKKLEMNGKVISRPLLNMRCLTRSVKHRNPKVTFRNFRLVSLNKGENSNEQSTKS